MDVVQILILFGLGGVFGAAGACFLYVIKHFLPKQFQQAILVICVVIAVVICVVIAVVLSQQAKSNFFGTSLEQQLSDGLREEPYMQLLAENFPEEFDALVTRVAKKPDAKYAKEQAFELTSSLRRENGHHVWTASTEKIDAYLNMSLDLYRGLRERHGDSVCSTFLYAGPNGARQILDEELAGINALALALFEAVLDGRDNTQTDRTLTTEDDFNTLFETWLAADGTQAMVQSIVNPTEGDDALCGAWISMTEQLLSMQLPLADRLKTHLVYNAAIG